MKYNELIELYKKNELPLLYDNSFFLLVYTFVDPYLKLCSAFFKQST